MTQGTTTAQAETYKGMLGGGIATLAGGGLGLVIIVVVGAFTDHAIPTGYAALAAVGVLAGSMILLAGLILRHVDKLMAELVEHRAEHQAVALDAEDIATMRRQLADVLAIVARWDVERAEERKMVAQVEAFLAWLAAAKQRANDAAPERAGMTPMQRDAAWMSDMAEAMEIGREIERRRPPE